jgi:hypothetical protein
VSILGADSVNHGHGRRLEQDDAREYYISS